MQSSLFKADWFSVIFLASCRLRDISSKTITSRLGSVLTSICSHFQDASTQKKIKEAENPPELSRNPVTQTPTNHAQWRISGRAAAIATLGSPRPTSRPSASPRPVETGRLPGDALGKSVKTYGKHIENIWKIMKRPLLSGIARMFSVLSQLPASQDAKIVIRMSTPRMSLKISPGKFGF